MPLIRSWQLAELIGFQLFRVKGIHKGSIGELGVLGGSWVLISGVIGPLMRVISIVKYSYPTYNPAYNYP